MFRCEICSKTFSRMRVLQRFCSRQCYGKTLIASVSDRLFSNIKKAPSGCIEWTGHILGSGYGKITSMGKTLLTHRVSYEICVGQIPDDMCVCHHCDNRCCVNPMHLFLGTDLDNARDRSSKGRSCFGERSPHAKLSIRSVSEIRRLAREGVSQRNIARLFDVSQASVQRIACFKTWKRVASCHQNQP